MVCEACYEDWVCATPIATKFYPRDTSQHKADSIWICDIASPYIKRTLLRCGSGGSWEDFIETARHFLHLPVCSNTAVNSSSRKWFRPMVPWPIERMMVCKACFLNHAGELSVARNFREVKLEPRHAVWGGDVIFKPRLSTSVPS